MYYGRVDTETDEISFINLNQLCSADVNSLRKKKRSIKIMNEIILMSATLNMLIYFA